MIVCEFTHMNTLMFILWTSSFPQQISCYYFNKKLRN